MEASFRLIEKNRRKEDLGMDERTRIMVSIGAAVSSNCVPCFEFYYDKACREKLTKEEIRESIDIANKVKNGARLHLKGMIRDMMEGDSKASNGTSCCEKTPSLCCG